MTLFSRNIANQTPNPAPQGGADNGCDISWLYWILK
jgi:hypothetical protein